MDQLPSAKFRFMKGNHHQIQTMQKEQERS